MSVESPQPSSPATGSRPDASAARTDRPTGPVQPERRPLAGVVVGVVIAAALVAVTLVLNRAAATDDAPVAAPTPTESVPTEPADGFPPLPAGADPALASKPTVTAGSGEPTELTVTTLVKGTGSAIEPGQVVAVNYVGVLYGTGEEFDASWNHRQPFEFQVGVGHVIPGWDRGLIGVTVGSRVQLDIPSELAYGEDPASGAPSGPLRFVVDVLAVR